ncbi:MAG: hypothetical protein ABI155_02485 [Paralcaligenes sp.]
MESGEHAKLLKLRMRVCLDEAPYIVLEQLGGTYRDALSLLIESAINKSFPADLVPRINQWSGKIIGPVEPSKSTVATADLSAWLATLHVHAQLDSDATDKDTLYPLGQAANTIASEKWPNTHAVLAEESWHLEFPDKPTPLLNGGESDRAFLAAMRHESQKSLQQAIDSRPTLSVSPQSCGCRDFAVKKTSGKPSRAPQNYCKASAKLVPRILEN